MSASEDTIRQWNGQLVVSYGGGKKKVAKCMGLTCEGKVRLDFGWDKSMPSIYECTRSHALKYYSVIK